MARKHSCHVIGSALVFLAGVSRVFAVGEENRFETYDLQKVPENANIMLFPYYGDFAFYQSAGVRYMRSSGEGMQYLYASHQQQVNAAVNPVSSTASPNSPEYGAIKKDGIEFPLVSQLITHNYFLLSKDSIFEATINFTYLAYPNGTEDNVFDIGPQVDAQMGSFSFGASKDGWLGAFNGSNMEAHGGNRGAGASANFSSDFELTPYLRGRLFDQPSYRVDYVDARGNNDLLSGQKYPVFQNLAGADMDWQMAPDKTFSDTFSRTDTFPQNNGYDITRSVVYHQMADYRQQLSKLTAAGIRSDTYWRDYLNKRGKQFQQDTMGYINSDVTEDTTVNASLGYSLAKISGGNGYETNGTSGVVIGSAGFTTRMTESLSHGFSYSRSQRAGFLAGIEVLDSVRYNIQWSNPDTWAVGFITTYEQIATQLGNASNYTDWMSQLSVSRPLAPDLLMTVATAYTMMMNDTPRAGQLGADNLFIANDYDTWGTTVGVVKSFTENLKLYLYGEHLVRLSSNAQLAGTRDTVGMTLGYYYDF